MLFDDEFSEYVKDDTLTNKGIMIAPSQSNIVLAITAGGIANKYGRLSKVLLTNTSVLRSLPKKQWRPGNGYKKNYTFQQLR